MRSLDRKVLIAASPADVWARVVTAEGINDEMWPWMTMSFPRGARNLTVDTVKIGEPVGRAWLRLFGLVPFDYDHLTVAELETGRRFLERSTMLSMRRWQHERTLTAVGGATQVHDRVTFVPRIPLPGLSAVIGVVLRAFFGHRHRRLQAHFSQEPSRR